jgi:hypothetical protein
MSSLTQVPGFSTTTMSEPAIENAPKTTIRILSPAADILESTTKSRSETSTQRASKATLLTLPSEIKFMIFSLLEPSFSTCLGLASKSLYPIHRAIHANVRLYEYDCCFLTNPYCWFHPLDYLTRWLEAGGWVFGHRKRKLVPIDFLKNEIVVHKQARGSNLKRCASV